LLTERLACFLSYELGFECPASASAEGIFDGFGGIDATFAIESFRFDADFA